jgi:hypothetical protein
MSTQAKMKLEMMQAVPYLCEHTACKCKIKEGDFCSEFCENLGGSETSIGCGCGHFACDSNAELGNDMTFHPGN